MKNIIFIIVSIFTFTACSEDFIDLAPISDQSTANFYKNQTDLEQAVVAAYDALQDGAQYGVNGFDHFMEIIADNTFNDNTTQNGGQFANFDNFNLVSNNTVLNSTWNSCYRGIQRCNIVLNRIDNIEMPDSLKAIRKGEVKFIRALTYFNLVRIWGDVPLVLNEVENPFEAFDHTRNKTDELYAQIIKDLEEAITALPLSFKTPNVGRATKGAAQALLGKVYLTRKQYPQAVTVLEQVILAGTYKLLPNFSDIFSSKNKNNAESIFEVQFKSGTNGEGISTTPPTNKSDVNNRPSNNIIKLFRENLDARFEASVALPTDAPAYSKKRLDDIGSDATFGFNMMVLRYADVLLMAAEALNEISYNNGKAFDYLNQVRNRAKATPYTATNIADQASFRQAIDKERRLELAFENHRWFDLLRTGKALEVMNAANAGGTSPNAASALAFTMKPHQVIFPLPQTQIDASAGKLTQNQGY